MKSIKYFLAVAFITFTFSAFSQADYKTAIGLRAAPSYGITLKHFLSSQSAIEGIISPRPHGFLITGLYEYHATAFSVDALNWYFGFGGHVGFWGADHFHVHSKNHNHWYYHDDHFDHDHDNVFGGVDMILGLEATFTKLPLNLSLDWKPGMNFINAHGFFFNDVGISIRFAFR